MKDFLIALGGVSALIGLVGGSLTIIIPQIMHIDVPQVLSPGRSAGLVILGVVLLLSGFSMDDGPAPYSAPATPSESPGEHWGAIAVARDGSIGKSWDYDTKEEAQSGALDRCSGPECKVLTTFVNGCGAVALNSDTGDYWGGNGDTEVDAENDAINNAGGGHWVAWVCTTR